MQAAAAEGRLGYELLGTGERRVIVTNDWLCDTSTWDAARAYFDLERFTLVFADLRGYGRSRGLGGEFTLVEAARDVLGVADALGWQRFSIVGHSMSALVALHLAQHHQARIERAVAITPPPLSGFGDSAAVQGSQALALADDAGRAAALTPLFGTRLSAGWTRYKLARWRATAEPVAAAAYVNMFARDGLTEPAAAIDVPLLAITGEEDAPPMRRQAVTEALGRLAGSLEVVGLEQCGHYPMEEMPPRTVSLVERFMAR